MKKLSVVLGLMLVAGMLYAVATAVGYGKKVGVTVAVQNVTGFSVQKLTIYNASTAEVYALASVNTNGLMNAITNGGSPLLIAGGREITLDTAGTYKAITNICFGNVLTNLNYTNTVYINGL